MSNKNSSNLGKQLINSIQEALEASSPGKIVRPIIDIVALRKKLNMTQIDFAKEYHINIKTLRQWEQGVRRPDLTSLAYLECISRAPEQISSILNC